MSKILVTGATGFIGSHLAEMFVELGLEVVAFDRYNSNNDWGWLENSKYRNDLEVILGDIRDFDSVYNVMKNCETVFHLAALIGIPYSYVSPIAYIRTNIEGTYNVLDAAKKLETTQVLITSTSETYGTAQKIPIKENHSLSGQSPYSATKISADQLALSYYLSFGLPVKIVRPFNTYGPRQSARAIIPTIISQFLNDEKLINLGNLSPTRDFTFVTDVCKGFFEIYKCNDLIGQVTNIGMNKEISIHDLVFEISKIMGINAKTAIDKIRIRPDNSEVERLKCDNSKLLGNTSWKPEYSLPSGLKKTIEWMESNLNLYKHSIYNV